MPVKQWLQGGGGGGNSEGVTRSGSARPLDSRRAGEAGGWMLKGEGAPTSPSAIITPAPLRNSDSIYTFAGRSGLSLPSGTE